MLGMSFTAYTIFLLGTLHILPFSQWGSYLVLLLWFIVFHIRFARNPNRLLFTTSFFKLIKNHWKIFLFEELLFLTGLFFLSYIRSFSPDIHGLEKYMDFGFINSILRTTYFPPKDMWFTPFSINYYYFGHLITAVLTKLSGIPSLITFNLMLGTILGLTFTAAFSIAANLIYFLQENKKLHLKIIVSGLLSAFLVTLGGNLHIIYAFFKPYSNDHPVPFWNLAYNPSGFPNSYWYPNATRFIYNTIHEFPIYSWVVSDLHGHVLDIPFVLTTIALLLSLMTKSQNTKSKQIINHKTQNSRTLKFKMWNLFETWNLEFGILKIKYILLLSFLLAVMYMTNAWDGGIYLLLTLLVLIYLKIKQNGWGTRKIYILTTVGYSLVAICAAFFLFSLPFSIFFSVSSIAHGIGIVCAPTFLTKIGHIGPFLFEPNHCQKSPWWQLMILYGFFAFFAVSFILMFFKKYFTFQGKRSSILQSDAFVLCLIILSTTLIIIPEFFYVKDIYPDYYRANTMFKLVFQAFIMLMLVSGYTFARFAGIFRTFLHKKRFIKIFSSAIWLFIAIWLCGLVALYPYLAFMSYYGNLQTYHGLDGTKYLQTLYPTDYDAINWINKNIQGQPVILEAQGDSYTDYARVSSNTGLPTVLGWTVHEWLWRGSYDIPSPRIADVQTMYTSTDVNTVKQLFKKYNVQYIFVGNLERTKYPTMTETVFKQLGKVVYQNGNTRIYTLNST